MKRNFGQLGSIPRGQRTGMLKSKDAGSIGRNRIGVGKLLSIALRSS